MMIIVLGSFREFLNQCGSMMDLGFLSTYFKLHFPLFNLIQLSSLGSSNQRGYQERMDCLNEEMATVKALVVD